MVIEGFEYIKSTNRIENLDLNIFLELLLKNDKSEYNGYNIKKILISESSQTEHKGIIIYSSKKEEMLMIDCVNKYYQITDTPNDCFCVRDYLDELSNGKNACTDCKSCHLKALNLYKELKLKKKPMEEM